MRTPRPSRPAFARLDDELAAGLVGALCFAIVLLALDVASLRSLLVREPATLPIFLIGAVLAFAPAVICGVFGRLGADETRDRGRLVPARVATNARPRR
jgi:prepilin signal peptidase PulO-like enzyme (type II secretory pathway)